MNLTYKQYLTALLAAVTVGASGPALPAQGMPPGHGMAHGNGPDMQTIHQLFAHSDQIRRSVRKLPDGVEAVTESSDPKVRAMLREHVHAMQARLHKRELIRAWDPLFAELFKHADQIKLEIADTEQGVKIRETSADAETVRLLHAHADAVSGFVKEGMSGMAKRHEVPGRQDAGTSAKPRFLGKGDGVRTCPVTGEPVDKKFKAVFEGRTVYFCCASCIPVVKKQPALYLPWKRPASQR
jgi:YHS domain-containing protein